MKVRLLSLGLCEKLDLNNKSWPEYGHGVRSIFKNKLFHFSINSKEFEYYPLMENNSKYVPDDQQMVDYYSEQKLKIIKPNGGYFNPFKIETQFYNNKIEISNEHIIEERQPLFFVLILPYPLLRFFHHNNHNKYGSSDWAGNPEPYKNQRFQTEIKRFSERQMATDLAGQIKLDNDRDKNDTINNFFDNNNYPLFVQEHDELITLINDLDNFYKNLHGFNLNFENLKKIVIPFFELNSSDIETNKDSEYIAF